MKRLCQPLLLLCLAGCLGAHASSKYPRSFDPDPERFTDSIARFAASDQEQSPPKGAIVCVGSSSMRMWHPRIAEDLAGLTVIPRGFGGSQFTDVIYYLDELILKYEPRAVLVYEGDNDTGAGKTPQRILDDLKFLVEATRARLPDVRFYIISAKPSIDRWHLAARMQSANALMEDYCHATPGLTFIDLWPGMLGQDGQPLPDIYVEDQLHLNENGYDIWAAVIAPVLKRGEAGFEAIVE